MLGYDKRVKNNANSEKPRINWQKYYAKPTKLWTSRRVLGTGHYMTVLTLSLLICTPVESISCPKNVIYSRKNWHFLRLP